MEGRGERGNSAFGMLVANARPDANILPTPDSQSRPPRPVDGGKAMGSRPAVAMAMEYPLRPPPRRRETATLFDARLECVDGPTPTGPLRAMPCLTLPYLTFDVNCFRFVSFCFVSFPLTSDMHLCVFLLHRPFFRRPLISCINCSHS